MSQIDVIKESIQNEQLLRESSTNNVLKGEYLIKDSHPDVYQILGIEAKATITNKETLADKIMIEGQINYSVMYLSEDESKVTSINSVCLSEKFADYLDLNNEEHKVICEVECVIEHIQASIMNERKIAIDGIRTTRWQLYKIEEFEFVKEIDGRDDIQVKRKSEEINQIKCEKDIELMGKSMIKVTMDKPEIDEILKCSMNLHKKEVKLGDGKIYFGCYCKIEVLCKGKDENDVFLLQDDIYLSKEEEAIGVNSEMMTSNQIDIVNADSIITADDLGENRVINVEFMIKGSIKVISKDVIDVIKDAYSPSKSIELTKKKYEIGLVGGIVTSELIIKDNLYPKDENDKIGCIICATGCPVITDKTVEEDKVKVEGVIKVSVLYKTTDDDCKIDMCNGEIPFTSVIDLKGTKPDMVALCKVHLENLDATIEANTIGVRATLSVLVKVCYKVNKEWIVDIVEGEEEKECKKASVTIYVVNIGDTLWDLAKKYNTTMDSLIEINELEGAESLTQGKKIIIPGKCKF
ncbi:MULTISPECIES: SPOCS domain-containing protein [unclassified Clostridium]|uniref:DUF3794 and LysM peptidoglycan-binding domain-containing protein n=1 Tax=Clostridium TaxID=1485 RepID=UPI001C8CAB05|nr:MULTISPECIES: SPOCS domain-containing protein [unclassified Clostridium]MBX9138185.1 DUF3794 domain-containing protein [Clostridium sp. K12(2020)]MBX9142895.1 DUF3794 domain-containing protein [Clostridium sp. K13]MDU2290146.1 DUF3794 domain-containing protein [Clostridium celatum]MDU4323954.1 DUF3794 domain-containing protein [Clostridium celatum]